MKGLKQNLKWSPVGIVLLIILAFPVIPARAELFTPTLDGAKAAGEYSKANSYQVVFTDPATNNSETGTVYAGRNTSHIHFALESAYPAGDAQGSIAFAVHYGEKTPHESQILDRKGVIYFYELATSTWRSSVVDENQKQGTEIKENETAKDVAGAGGLSQTKLFVEMSIPITQTDAEPYDRHLVVDEKVAGGFSMQRGYYNATDNTEWGFDGRSDVYYITLGLEELTIIKAGDDQTSNGFQTNSGFELIIAGMSVITVIGIKKKRRK